MGPNRRAQKRERASTSKFGLAAPQLSLLLPFIGSNLRDDGQHLVVQRIGQHQLVAAESELQVLYLGNPVCHLGEQWIERQVPREYRPDIHGTSDGCGQRLVLLRVRRDAAIDRLPLLVGQILEPERGQWQLVIAGILFGYG